MVKDIPPPSAGIAAGRRGGILASQRMSPEARQERASKAGSTTLRLYGIDYYSSLGRKEYLAK